MYTIYMGLTEFRNHIFYKYGFETLFYAVLIQSEIQTILILDIDDQNTVFASKGTHAAYLNLKFPITLRYIIDSKSILKE